MTDIHDILAPINPPDYSFLIYWLIFIIILLFIFFIFKIINNKKGKPLIIEKYHKKDFLKDLIHLNNQAKEDFNSKLWKELNILFKKFHSINLNEKIHHLSLKESIANKKLKHLKKIFETFDSQFYHYQKKWKEGLISLIDIIKSDIIS